MTLIHAAGVTGSSIVVSTDLVLASVAAALVVVHGVRLGLLLADDRAAGRWLAARTLPDSPRARAEVMGYLVRLRAARLGGAVLFLVLCTVATWLFEVSIGVLSGPFLLAVLVAELLAPAPRQGRQRVAPLERRPASYFAPLQVVVVVRALLLIGLALSVLALRTDDAHQVRAAVAHLVVLAAGAVTYEAGLRAISGRGLPSGTEDLARDSAVRVASSRTATAAGLMFAAIGAFYALFLLGLPGGERAALVVSQVVTAALTAAAGVVIWLVQPVSSWRPRTA